MSNFVLRGRCTWGCGEFYSWNNVLKEAQLSGTGYFPHYLPLLSVTFLLLTTHVHFPRSVPALLSSALSACLGTPITRGGVAGHWLNQDVALSSLIKCHFSQHINCFLIFWEEFWSFTCASAVNLWCDHRFYSVWKTTQERCEKMWIKRKWFCSIIMEMVFSSRILSTHWKPLILNVWGYSIGHRKNIVNKICRLIQLLWSTFLRINV